MSPISIGGGGCANDRGGANIFTLVENPLKENAKGIFFQ